MVPGCGAYGGLLVEGWHLSHPVGPPQRDTPPAQGGIEILGIATLADVVCGAVGLPLAHAAQVLAVQGVSVHRQIGGSSCF